MMKRKLIITIFLALIVALYVLSYRAMSLKGYYNPRVYGLRQGTNGLPIVAPKGLSPYVWNPYTETPMTTYQAIDDSILLRLRAKYLLYLPLYSLDREFWHKDQDFSQGSQTLQGFPYPVKNYFDDKTLSYRSYEPE